MGSDLTYKDLFSDAIFHKDEPNLENRKKDNWVVRDSPIGQKWMNYVLDLTPAQDWKFALLGLSYLARTEPSAKITIASEVQLIFKPYMDGRVLSHLLFKISRRETGVGEMARDFTHGYGMENDSTRAHLEEVKAIAKSLRGR